MNNFLRGLHLFCIFFLLSYSTCQAGKNGNDDILGLKDGVVQNHDHAIEKEFYLPKWEFTYNMSRSTIIMPCNYSGYVDTRVYDKWGIVDFDWSNTKHLWANAKPMNCQEELLIQAKMAKEAMTNANGMNRNGNNISHSSARYGRVLVYRNLVKALPWYTEVRDKILDPQYSGWFLRYKNDGKDTPTYDDGNSGHKSSYFSPPCTGEKCSVFYHDQLQTPMHYGKDKRPSRKARFDSGTCADECDCGVGLPCGEYLWDHRNTSLRKWLIDDFLLGSKYGLGHEAIDGFYLDDSWHAVVDSWEGTTRAQQAAVSSTWAACSASPTGGASEEEGHCAIDMGLTATDVADITANWSKTVEMAKAAILEAGGFTWGASSMFSGTGARSLEAMKGISRDPREICLDYHRGACRPDNWIQHSAYIFEFTQQKFMDPLPLPCPKQDVASFLLVRGPYAWIGYNWMGCFHDEWVSKLRPSSLLDDVDYGVPVDEHCTETVPGKSGVFTRRWTKANVVLDCNDWSAQIDMVSDGRSSQSLLRGKQSNLRNEIS